MSGFRFEWQRIVLLALALPLFATRVVPEEPGKLLRQLEDWEQCYLIRVGLGNQGYLGARVEKAGSGPEKLFKVEFGPLYRLRRISVTGVKLLPVDELLKRAPKPGNVYSQVLMNACAAFVEKKYAEQGLRIKCVREEGTYDHVKRDVSVRLEFSEGS